MTEVRLLPVRRVLFPNQLASFADFFERRFCLRQQIERKIAELGLQLLDKLGVLI